MRIEVKPSARAHGINDTEIRTVINFYVLTAALIARKPDSQPALFIGPAIVNEP